MDTIDCMEMASRVACNKPMHKRLVGVMDRMRQRPADSFPAMLATSKELQGFYRMLDNDDVTFEKVFEPHAQGAVEKSLELGELLVVHDTSEFRFGGEAQRKGLGRINKNDQGFIGHFSMAFTSDGEHLPIGVLMVQPIVRGGDPVRGTLKEQYNREGKESGRWAVGVEACEGLVGVRKAIHVMDREADDFALQAQLVASSTRFIIRTKGMRTLAPTKDVPSAPHNVGEFFAAKKRGSFHREVPLSSRGHKRSKVSKRNHPPREKRMALLHFTAGTLEIRRPPYVDKKHPKALRLNVVHIKEDLSTVPEGEPAVEWFLSTNEPVDTQEQIVAVVDAYRARWGIEEFFKALKTGCAFESRQLESLEALLIVLAMFISIATNLLLLRCMARAKPEAPASAALSELTLTVLKAMTPLKQQKVVTVADALTHIAALGGHIKNNGNPGWLVLSRGYEKLETFRLAWAVAQETEQS